MADPVERPGGAMSEARVLCVGAIVLDHVLEVRALPTGEGKHVAQGSRWGGGGNAATAAVAVAQLGGRAAWTGLVGDDPAGRTVLEMLRDCGVEVGEGSVLGGGSTSVSCVLVDAEGRRWVGFYRGTNLDASAGSWRLPSVGGAGAVLADQVHPRCTASAFRSASGKGIPRVLDFEDARAEAATELAQLADHVVFSADGLSGFTGVAEPQAGLAIAREKLGEVALGVKIGPQGSVWLTDEGVWRMAAPTVRARDTTGCGDVFHGAYAFSVARGLSAQGAARFATAAAAIKAQKGAGWLGMPSREETDALIGRGW